MMKVKCRIMVCDGSVGSKCNTARLGVSGNGEGVARNEDRESAELAPRSRLDSFTLSVGTIDGLDGFVKLFKGAVDLM